MPRNVAVEPVMEGGLEALKVTVIVPAGVLAQSVPEATQRVEGLMGQACDAVRRHMTKRESVAA